MGSDAANIDTAIREQAARWMLQLEDEFGPVQRAMFATWLKQSPRHTEEFLLVSALWMQLDMVDPERRIDLRALLKAAGCSAPQLP